MTAVDTSPLHRQIWDLIPWVVNGSADAGERERVEEHLRECADCRDEYAFQVRLQAGIAADVADAPEPDPQPALRRLLARIDLDPQREADAALRAPGSPRRWPRGRVLAAVVFAQAIGLALLAAVLLRQERGDADARYRTLTRAAEDNAAATIRFVPAPTLTLAELQTMLADAGLHIVDSRGSIYALAPATDRGAATAAAIAHLRAQPGVLLAEPIAKPADEARQ